MSDFEVGVAIILVVGMVCEDSSSETPPTPTLLVLTVEND